MSAARKRQSSGDSRRSNAHASKRAGVEPLVLALQRTAGNAAVSRVLARRPAPGHPDQVEFRVGVEIGGALAGAAKKAAPGGVTVAELRGLRKVALGDETIDHEERGFLAGLLEPANATQVAGAAAPYRFSKASIDAHLSEVADLDRPQLDEAVGDALTAKWKAVVEGDPDAVTKHLGEEEAAERAQMTRLVGKSREPKLRTVLAYASANGVLPGGLLTAMIGGASDSTPGDMLMAATVYAIAAGVQHPLADQVGRGTIKVDAVPKAQLGVADASYSAEGMGKDKGDTIYVPESLSVDNVAHRSQVIHELEHALQDRGATAGLVRVDAELGGYRAQGAYLLKQIAPLRGAERDKAIDQLVHIMNGILIRAMILESRSDPKVHELTIVDINSAMPANVQLGMGDLAAWIATSDAQLITEAKAQIMSLYGIGAGDIGPGAGLGREHDTSRM
jgi:hypothetical protein